MNITLGRVEYYIGSSHSLVNGTPRDIYPVQHVVCIAMDDSLLHYVWGGAEIGMLMRPNLDNLLTILVPNLNCYGKKIPLALDKKNKLHSCMERLTSVDVATKF